MNKIKEIKNKIKEFTEKFTEKFTENEKKIESISVASYQLINVERVEAYNGAI